MGFLPFCYSNKDFAGGGIEENDNMIVYVFGSSIKIILNIYVRTAVDSVEENDRWKSIVKS